MEKFMKLSRKTKILSILSILVIMIGGIYFGINGTGKGSESTGEVVDYTKEISADRIYDTIKQFSAKDNARITGFEGEESTAAYLVKQFKEMGLSVKEQSFPIKSYYCSNVEVTDAESKKMTARFLSFSKATPKEGITAELVNGGMGSEAELNAVDVKDKLVLVKRGGELFRTKTDRAFYHGALGVIFYDPNQEGPITATLVEPSSIPAASISKTDAETCEASIKAGKTVKLILKLDSICKDGTSKNIIATLKGSGKYKGKNLVVGAHYDGVDTPAANDNASGISTVLETARVMSKQKLDCDVNFIAFGAEEIGLNGSQYYVGTLGADDMENIVCMMNFDMVGIGDTLSVHTASNTDQSKFVKLATGIMDSFGYKNSSSAQENSDHVPFERAGIPTAYFEYGPYTNYHTDKDTIEYIQKENLLKVCNTAANMINELGNNPDKYPR